MDRKMDMRPLFSPRTLAERLDVSERTVREWLADGTIPSFKIGHFRRIHPADVDAFLEARQDRAPVGDA